jgi:hypothetical protein
MRYDHLKQSSGSEGKGGTTRRRRKLVKGPLRDLVQAVYDIMSNDKGAGHAIHKFETE